MSSLVRKNNPVIKLSYKDYVLFPYDGKKHELIDGDHYMVPDQNTRHQAISASIVYLITQHIYTKKMGKLFHAPIDVVLSEFDVVQPDIVYVSEERLEILTEANIKGAPDLVIEIISDSSRRIDKVLKKDLYAKYGVREFWLIDPVVDTIEVFVLEKGLYVRKGEYSTNGTISTDQISGLHLNLKEIFSRH